MKLGEQTLWVDTVQGNIDKYVERLFIPLLKPVMKYCSWNKQRKILMLPRGGIDFGSSQHPENLEGFDYPRAVLNEAGHILKKESLWYNTLLPMIKSKHNQTKIIGTPKGKGLFYRLYLDGLEGKKGFSSYRYTVHDSPFWSQEQILEAQKNTPAPIFNQEYMAAFEDFVGLIYPDFKYETHVVGYPEHKPTDIYFIGLDVGWNHPTAILLAKEDTNHNLFILDEVKESLMDPTDISNNIKALLMRNNLKKDNIQAFIIDPSSKKTEQTSGASMFDQLVELGWPLVPGINEVLGGISRVTRLLKEGKLLFTKKCPKTVEEIQEYHWKEVAEGSDTSRNRPFKVKDDCVDALKYIVMSRPDWFEHPQLDNWGRVVNDPNDITYNDPEEDDIIDMLDSGGDLMEDGGSIY
jgi:hypothetical protein